jgi:hypothetical protein
MDFELDSSGCGLCVAFRDLMWPAMQGPWPGLQCLEGGFTVER